MKVCTIVGTRPEIIRLSRIIDMLNNSCDHTLVHTGQNFDHELSGVFFEEMGLKLPTFQLHCAGSSAIDTISKVLSYVDDVLEEIKPDAILVLGDTNSAYGALAAKRRKIPIFHMEAGNRSFDQRVPEEINRKLIDHLADINMPYTAIAREYLLKENFPADQIIKTGSPLPEVINYYKVQIEEATILKRLNLLPKEYFLVSMHREENVDVKESIDVWLKALEVMGNKYQKRIIVSTHPRTRKKIEEFGYKPHSIIEFSKPFGFFDYLKLQRESLCVISDSGTITEESAILNFPAVTVREVHERPEGMEEGVLIMTGMNIENILNSVELAMKSHDVNTPKVVDDYISLNVAEKVLKVIFSYTHFINTKVWRK